MLNLLKGRDVYSDGDPNQFCEVKFRENIGKDHDKTSSSFCRPRIQVLEKNLKDMRNGHRQVRSHLRRYLDSSRFLTTSSVDELGPLKLVK
jgi:hypothetical protein